MALEIDDTILEDHMGKIGWNDSAKQSPGAAAQPAAWREAAAARKQAGWLNNFEINLHLVFRNLEKVFVWF